MVEHLFSKHPNCLIRIARIEFGTPIFISQGFRSLWFVTLQGYFCLARQKVKNRLEGFSGREETRTLPPPKEHILENFSGRWSIQKPYKNQKKPYLPPKSFLCGPHFLGKEKFLPGAGWCIWKEGKDPHTQDKIQRLDFTKDPRPLHYKTPPSAFYHKNVRSKAVFGP